MRRYCESSRQFIELSGVHLVWRSSMEYRRLGQTDLHISCVAFGCWAIGGHGWGRVDDRESVAAIRKALELGINFFDTADVYGFGHSEEILSRALGERRKEVVIATKFGVKWDDQGRIKHDISANSVIESLDNSLRRLRIDCIPLYQVHWPDAMTPIAITMERLVRCQEAGKIRHIGCCNLSVELVRQARKIGTIESLQAPYNIVDRAIKDSDLTYYMEVGIAVLAYSPLAQGLLSGKYGPEVQFDQDDIRSRSGYFHEGKGKTNVEVVRLVTEIGRRHGKTPAQVAIRWILDNPWITCALTGMKTVHQVEENAGTNWALSQEDWEIIDRLSCQGRTADDPRG